LIGGEEPEYISKSEVYMIDLKDRKNGKLIQKSSMIYTRFDCALCYFDDSIYVVGGKNNVNDVVDDCERYSISEDRWYVIESIKWKRYAASLCGTRSKKLYLFGGRGEI